MADESRPKGRGLRFRVRSVAGGGHAAGGGGQDPVHPGCPVPPLQIILDPPHPIGHPPIDPPHPDGTGGSYLLGEGIQVTRVRMETGANGETYLTLEDE